MPKKHKTSSKKHRDRKAGSGPSVAPATPQKNSHVSSDADLGLTEKALQGLQLADVGERQAQPFMILELWGEQDSHALFSMPDGKGFFYLIGFFLVRKKQNKKKGKDPRSAFYDVGVLGMRTNGNVREGEWIPKQDYDMVERLLQSYDENSGQLVRLPFSVAFHGIIQPALDQMRKGSKSVRPSTKLPLMMFKQQAKLELERDPQAQVTPLSHTRQQSFSFSDVSISKLASEDNVSGVAPPEMIQQFQELRPLPPRAMLVDTFLELFFCKPEFRSWWVRKSVLKRSGCTMPPERQLSHRSHRWALKTAHQLQPTEHRRWMVGMLLHTALWFFVQRKTEEAALFKGALQLTQQQYIDNPFILAYLLYTVIVGDHSATSRSAPTSIGPADRDGDNLALHMHGSVGADDVVELKTDDHRSGRVGDQQGPDSAPDNLALLVQRMIDSHASSKITNVELSNTKAWFDESSNATCKICGSHRATSCSTINGTPCFGDAFYRHVAVSVLHAQVELQPRTTIGPSPKANEFTRLLLSLREKQGNGEARLRCLEEFVGIYRRLVLSQQVHVALMHSLQEISSVADTLSSSELSTPHRGASPSPTDDESKHKSTIEVVNALQEALEEYLGRYVCNWLVDARAREQDYDEKQQQRKEKKERLLLEARENLTSSGVLPPQSKEPEATRAVEPRGQMRVKLEHVASKKSAGQQLPGPAANSSTRSPVEDEKPLAAQYLSAERARLTSKHPQLTVSMQSAFSPTQRSSKPSSPVGSISSSASDISSIPSEFSIAESALSTVSVSAQSVKSTGSSNSLSSLHSSSSIVSTVSPIRWSASVRFSEVQEALTRIFSAELEHIPHLSVQKVSNELRVCVHSFAEAFCEFLEEVLASLALDRRQVAQTMAEMERHDQNLFHPQVVSLKKQKKKPRRMFPSKKFQSIIPIAENDEDDTTVSGARESKAGEANSHDPEAEEEPSSPLPAPARLHLAFPMLHCIITALDDTRLVGSNDADTSSHTHTVVLDKSDILACGIELPSDLATEQRYGFTISRGTDEHTVHVVISRSAMASRLVAAAASLVPHDKYSQEKGVVEGGVAEGDCFVFLVACRLLQASYDAHKHAQRSWQAITAPLDDDLENCHFSGCDQRVPAADLKLCGKCRIRQYCSRECQVAHWTEGHKQECKFLRKLQK